MNQQSAAEPSLPGWLAGPEWPLPSRFLRTGQGTIHYIDVGDGPTILFVHTAAWSFIWRDVITRLQPSFRCVAFDFPGTGLSSSAAPGSARLTAYSGLLEEVCERLGLTDLTLVLHDLAGAVGLSFAGRHPGQIRGLVMTQAFGWPPQPAMLRFALRVMGSFPVRTLDVASNIVPRISARNFGVGRHLTPAGRKAFLGVYANRAQRRTMHDQLRDSVRSPVIFESAQRALKGPLAGKPLLTIFGSKNDPFGFQQHWKELFPHAIQHVVNGGHHFPMNDDPDLFAGAVRDFAASAQARSASQR